MRSLGLYLKIPNLSLSYCWRKHSFEDNLDSQETTRSKTWKQCAHLVGWVARTPKTRWRSRRLSVQRGIANFVRFPTQASREKNSDPFLSISILCVSASNESGLWRICAQSAQVCIRGSVGVVFNMDYQNHDRVAEVQDRLSNMRENVSREAFATRLVSVSEMCSLVLCWQNYRTLFLTWPRGWRDANIYLMSECFVPPSESFRLQE